MTQPIGFERREPFSQQKPTIPKSIPPRPFLSSLPTAQFAYYVVSKCLDRDVNYLKFAFSERKFTHALETERYNWVKQMILANRFNELMVPGKYCREPKTDHWGNCALYFEELAECACPHMSRKLHPEFRNDYEGRVLEKAVEIAQNHHEITITFFAPGVLATELSLLIKVIDALNQITWKGRLNLHFIDWCYVMPSITEERGALQKEILSLQIRLRAIRVREACANAGIASKKRKLEDSFVSTVPSPIDEMDMQRAALQNQQTKEKRQIQEIEMQHKTIPSDTRASTAIPKLLTYLQLGLSQGMQVKTRFFGEAEEYISLCKTDRKFESHLLVGIDFQHCELIFENLRQTTQSPGGQAISLAKKKIDDQSAHVILKQTEGTSFQEVRRDVVTAIV